MTSPQSGFELIEDVRSGRRKAVDIVAATLDRIARFDPELTCFTVVLAERAKLQAAEIDAMIARGKDPGPLAGLPFAVKDLFDVEGIPTTAGSAILKDAPSVSANAPVAERLIQAGAILIGTLNMDEFAYGFATVNRHYGTTKNPHDLMRLAGGSSGGSAASVTAGILPLTLGSDTNGSVRVPASLCGIYGLRPTHGTLTTDGTFPFVERLDTVGLFTRNIPDMRASFEVMSGKTCETAKPDGIKAGLLTGWFQSGAQTEILDAAKIVFEALGGKDDVELSLATAGRSAAFLLTASEGGHLHLPNLRTQPMAFDPATRDRLIAGALLPDSVIQKAESVAEASIDELLSALETHDVLIAPSTPSTAPEIEAGLIEIEGKMVSARANLGLYTQPLSLAGVPILSVPLKRSGKLPLGVQLIAARGREDLLFHLAEKLESKGVIAVETPAKYCEALT